MRRLKLVIAMMLLIGVLLVAEVLFVKSLSNYEPEIGVVFTRGGIPAKTVITEDMLQIKNVNISEIHPLSVRSMAELIGKTALADLEANEMVLSSRAGLSLEMDQIQMEKKDNRLFSVEFKPDQANGWWVLVGQRVDILFVRNEVAAPAAPTADKVEDLNIVRLDNIRIAAIIDENGKLLDNGERASAPKMISFEVTPEQDQFLAWAKSNGRLEVSVRTSMEAGTMAGRGRVSRCRPGSLPWPIASTP